MAGTIVLDAITDGTGNTVSGSTVVKGSAKAWVIYTVSGTTPTINDSYNVSSITYVSTGIFTITLTNGFTNTNFCCFGNANYYAAGTLAGYDVINVVPMTASTAGLSNYCGGTARNSVYYSAVFFK